MANFLSKLFGGGKNPASAAMPYLNQVDPMAKQNLGPWANQGQTAQSQNQGQYSRMVENPADFYAQLHSTYSPSKGYQMKQENYQRQMENAAAAGGFRGTPTDQDAQTRLSQSLLEEDENNYYDKLMNILGKGFEGNEAIANRGFQGASDLTGVLGTNLGNKATLAYKGQESENEQKNAFKKMLFQLIGAGLGSFGGPAGATIGSQIGGSLAGGSGNSSGSYNSGTAQNPAYSATRTQQFGNALYGMGK